MAAAFKLIQTDIIQKIRNMTAEKRYIYQKLSISTLKVPYMQKRLIQPEIIMISETTVLYGWVMAVYGILKTAMAIITPL